MATPSLTKPYYATTPGPTVADRLQIKLAAQQKITVKIRQTVRLMRRRVCRVPNKGQAVTIVLVLANVVKSRLKDVTGTAD